MMLGNVRSTFHCTQDQRCMGLGKPMSCIHSRAPSTIITCSSANSSSNKAVPKRTQVSSPASAGGTTSKPAAVVAAATATAVTVQETAGPPVDEIKLVNPPLGFANNIVPAGPLVVTQPQHGADLVDSSDEELDESSPSPSQGTAAAAPGGGTGRSSAWRCLVLDSRYLPVNVVPWGRAIVMDLSGKVDVLEYHPNGYAYSAYKRHPLPAVLRVHTFVDVHEFAGRLPLTRKNIMLRDHHRCQYCGASKELTLDHVNPVCRGGINSWQNLVTACMSCNQRKGDKSLQQLGWKLPQSPREPTPQEVGVLAGISKTDLEQPPLPWVPYLAAFKAALEKAQKRSAAPRPPAASSSIESFLAEQQQLLGAKKQGPGGAKAAVKASATVAGGQSGSSKKAPKRMRH